MLKILGLIRTLGWKHFLWKVWLLGRKKAGAEAWFSRSMPYTGVQSGGLKVADYLQSTYGVEPLAGALREKIENRIRSLGLPADHLQAMATDLLNNRIPYFSHRIVSLPRLDFNYNPLEDIHVPTGRHSSRYASFDPAIGDLKKVWELNRFQWANPLVTAYLLSEDKERRHALRKFYENALAEWLAQCPHERSVAWACSQEISIRCLNWLWAIYLMEITSEDILQPLLNAIRLSVRHVYRQIDFARAQRNNHAITESVFLILFAEHFPAVADSQSYRAKGREVLAECLEDQFLADGGYIQNSHTYHRFALQCLCTVYRTVDDAALSALLRRKMEASYHFLRAQVANEVGDFPNFGPNDGAMLCHFGGSDYRDLRPVLNLLAAVLQLELPFDDPGALADIYCLGLTAGAIRQSSALTKENQLFPQTGLAILHNGDFKAYFRCADLTGRYPSSSDQLHLDFWYRGRNVLIDTGTQEYFSREHPERLALFLSTKAHNTARIDGLDQMEKGPRFTYLSKANGTILRWDPEQGVVAGEHDGFRGRVAASTCHRRQIEWQHPLLVVRDAFSAVKGRVELFWHLAVDERVERRGERTFLLKTSGLQLDIAADTDTNIALETFPCSRYYATAADAPLIVITLPGSGDAEVETRISPLPYYQ